MEENRLAICINCEDHAVALDAPYSSGLKIQEHGDLFADKIIRQIHRSNARDDLPFLCTDIDLQGE
jgi:hypothetical protein